MSEVKENGENILEIQRLYQTLKYLHTDCMILQMTISDIPVKRKLEDMQLQLTRCILDFEKICKK